MVAGRHGRFATTHWSLVLAAARADEPDGRRALETLCEQYWYPLYIYVRRRGHSADDAQDLTQAFFARLLEKRDVRHASPDRGHFRSFLLASLQNFLHNASDRERALKRGGGAPIVSIDLPAAEQRYHIEPQTTETPEDLFHRRWALTVLEHAMAELRDEYTRDGRGDLFARLHALLAADGTEGSYRVVGEALGMSEGAVKVAAHRMRRRFRDTLRTEIAQTVDPAELDGEIQFLLAAVGRRREAV